MDILLNEDFKQKSMANLKQNILMYSPITFLDVFSIHQGLPF